MAENWNWNNSDEKSSTVVPAVEAVAVYENEDQNVVIRQQNSYGDGDSIIIIPRAHVASVIKALTAFKGKALNPQFVVNPTNL